MTRQSRKRGIDRAEKKKRLCAWRHGLRERWILQLGDYEFVLRPGIDIADLKPDPSPGYRVTGTTEEVQVTFCGTDGADGYKQVSTNALAPVQKERS